MSTGLASYLSGSLSLVAIVAALGFGAYHLRRWILPEFTGALARLAEVILGTSLLVLTLQVVGSAGLLAAGWIPAACVGAGIVAGLVGRSRVPANAEARRAPPPSVSGLAALTAAGVAAWCLAEWSIPTQLALDRGMFGGDTTWYHMPVSARFAQEASILGLHFTDPLGLAVWFYPQTYELINGASIAIFGSDFVVPLMNLGWLGAGLLAAWCVGRPYGVAPATLLAGGLVFNSGVMWETQAGEARNDMMALALLLAAAAILVNGHQIWSERELARTSPRGALMGAGPLIAAGLAAGLAISVKLTMLAPVGAIVLGLAFASGPRARRRTVWALGGALLATGAYWYLRNLIHAGNPLPLIEGIGPLDLPHPEQMDLYPRPPESVAGYLFEPTVYRQWFIPQLDNALGPLWAPLLGFGLGSALYLFSRGRDPILRVLGAAALLTALLYVFTPITASGTYGQPKGFFPNTRYLMPALVLGLALLPLAPRMRESERRRRQVLALLAGAFALTALTTVPWRPAYLGGAILVAAFAVATPLALAWLRSAAGLRLGALGAIALAIAAAAIALGRAQEVSYANGRYANPGPFWNEVAGPVKAFEWARDVRDRRIGVVGAGQVFFTQYGWYGLDLSNYVQYVGVHGPNGAFRVPATCEELRGAINTGSYDYLVSTAFGTNDENMEDFPVREWLQDDPALHKLLVEKVYPQADWVYRVDGPLDPRACP